MKRMLQLSLLMITIMLHQSLFAAKKPTAELIFDADKPNIILTSSQPQFTIKLKSNPTTGYSWFLRDYDQMIFVPVKHAFIPPQGGLMGAPGFETFTFKVKNNAYVMPQVSSIRFLYMRPFAGVDSASQSLFHVSLMKK